MDFDIKIFLPIIIINLVLVAVSLFDLVRRDRSRVRWGNKIIWGLVILLIQTIGPTAYLILGRVEK